MPKNFTLLQNDSETGTIFSQPPLIQFERDKNIGNFLVRSSFQTNDQPGTFKCAHSRCKLKDQRDPLGLMITSQASLPVSSTA